MNLSEYDRSRIEFKWWVLNNRPRHGPIYHVMRYALRQCNLDERLNSSNKMVNHTQRHDVNAFWKDIIKHTKSKSDCLTALMVLQEKLILLTCGDAIINNSK